VKAEDRESYLWLSGEDFTEMINRLKGQWIWGVFSGFTKKIKLNDILKSELPYADGYSGFWENNITIQHPLAEIEIVAFDSSLTLFISKNNQLEDLCKSQYKQADYLEHYNTK